MAMIGRTQIGMKDITRKVTVPDHPKAKLMYYLSCVGGLFDLEEDDDDFKRLTNYNQYQRLSESETAQLMLFCLLLSPDVLIDKCIFQEDALCGDMSNKIYELSVVSHRLLVASSLMIGGQQRRVRKIMTFKMSWLRNNYLEPIQHFQREMEAQRRRRETCVVQ